MLFVISRWANRLVHHSTLELFCERHWLHGIRFTSVRLRVVFVLLPDFSHVTLKFIPCNKWINDVNKSSSDIFTGLKLHNFTPKFHKIFLADRHVPLTQFSRLLQDMLSVKLDCHSHMCSVEYTTRTQDFAMEGMGSPFQVPPSFLLLSFPLPFPSTSSLPIPSTLRLVPPLNPSSL